MRRFFPRLDPQNGESTLFCSANNKNVPYKIRGKAEKVNPYADISAPKVIIDGRRILGPKNQSIFGNYHGIKIAQDLS